jgi:uncharacterized membrane protein YsdA (DUF1294 family)
MGSSCVPVNFKTLDQVLLAWLGVMSVVTFFMFGYDKWRAGRAGERVSEARLIWFSALGGWLGGLLGMIVFRHKTSKGSFKLKFAIALLPGLAGWWARFHWP